LLNDSVRSAI